MGWGSGGDPRGGRYFLLSCQARPPRGPCQSSPLGSGVCSCHFEGPACI